MTRGRGAGRFSVTEIVPSSFLCRKVYFKNKTSLSWKKNKLIWTKNEQRLRRNDDVAFSERVRRSVFVQDHSVTQSQSVNNFHDINVPNFDVRTKQRIRQLTQPRKNDKTITFHTNIQI